MILAVVVLVYWPGLSGGWLFDDYPNIVDNHGVQPSHATVSSLVAAALSSPASDFKRPLSSLSFAANFLAGGLDPYWMKLTNLVIHLLNGVLVFWLACMLLLAPCVCRSALGRDRDGGGRGDDGRARGRSYRGRTEIVALLIAAGWMLLPINLTGVLYVVQRMESLANLFVLAGLVGYMTGRRRMLARMRGGLAWCVGSLVLGSGIGVLAKETAVMLPLYALLVEAVLFGFRTPDRRRDRRVIGLFVLVLLLPMLVGLTWLLPRVLAPESWASRDFTLATRLLSEARIVVGYIGWTLLPLPHELSFYHDDVVVSTGLLQPWTTLPSVLVLAALLAAAVAWRGPRPLVSLGIALFLGCHLLTGTILPLELVYEHRNYFASFGLLLAVVPWLTGFVARPWAEGGPGSRTGCAPAGNLEKSREVPATTVGAHLWAMLLAVRSGVRASPTSELLQRHRTKESFCRLPAWAWVGRGILGLLLVWWTGLTAYTAYAWGEPLRLAQELAERAPTSPRAQYELGRTYIIDSHYDPGSPYTEAAYAPLERAAALPESSILPQQALIFMNSRMGRPLKDAWWDSMTAKLRGQRPGVQDESSLSALVQCARTGDCPLPHARMVAAFQAALSHPDPSARLLASYGDYLWNVLGDHAQGEAMTERAVQAAPDEPAYRITLARMLLEAGHAAAAEQQVRALERLNIGGRLDDEIEGLSRQIQAASTH